MADKLTPIIQVTSENPEILPAAGAAYRGWEIANGLASIEQKYRDDQEAARRREEARIVLERQFAEYKPYDYNSLGSYIASRPTNQSGTNQSTNTFDYNREGTYIMAPPSHYTIPNTNTNQGGLSDTTSDYSRQGTYMMTPQNRPVSDFDRKFVEDLLRRQREKDQKIKDAKRAAEQKAEEEKKG